jgi:hypothetical protein
MLGRPVRMQSATIFLGTILLCYLGFIQFQLPQPAPVSSPGASFSALRAWEHLQVIGQSPHPIGSARQGEVRDYILDQLTSLGYVPELQQTIGVNSRVGSAGRVENIVARLPGSASHDAILIQAHYDSVADGPGATDNGSGAATLLELAREFRARPALQNDLIFLFTDGEEEGTLGASAFLTEHPWASQVRIVLNLDTARATPTALTLATPQNGWLVHEYLSASPAPLASSAMNELFHLLSTQLHLLDTDLSPWIAGDVPGYLFMTVYLYPQYHTLLDNLDSVDLRAVQHMGDQAAGLAAAWGNLGLAPANQPDAIYANLLGRWMLTYPSTWALPLTSLAVLGWGVLLVRGIHSGRLRGRHLAWNLAWILVTLMLSLLAGFLIWQGIASFSPAAQVSLVSMHRYGDFWWMGGLALVLVGLFLLSWKFIRSRTTAFSREMAGIGLWLVFLGLSTRFAVGLSYLFVWPVLFGLARLAWIVTRPGSSAAGTAGPADVSALVAAVPALLLDLPFLYVIFLAIGVALVPALALLWTILLIGLLPLLEALASPHPRLIPTFGIAVGLVVIGVGLYQAQFSPSQPRPSQIQYWQDLDTGQSAWMTPAGALDQRQASRVSPGDPVIQGSTFLAPLGSASVRLHSAPAFPEMGVDILQEAQTVSGDEQVTLHLRASQPLNAWQVWIPGGLGIHSLEWDGSDLPVPTAYSSLPAGSWLPLIFYAPAADRTTLRLSMAATPSFPVYVWAVTSGLPEFPGETALSADPSLMPISNMTIVSQSVSIQGPD